MKYDVDYFIEKFTGIPSRLWCMGTLTDEHGRHCALGHCYASENGLISSDKLRDLFTRYSHNVVLTNDDNMDYNLGQGRKTPRGRILAALRWIKKQEAKAC